MCVCVFVWGQLGLGDAHSRLTPALIGADIAGRVLRRVLQAACGNAHTAAVTDAGHLYTWGDGSNGQLGHGDFDMRYRPAPVEKFQGGREGDGGGGGASFRRVIIVACGVLGVHTVAIVEEATGQPSEDAAATATALLLPPHAASMASAASSSHCQTLSNPPAAAATGTASPVTRALFTWGCNFMGQLGHEVEREDAHAGGGELETCDVCVPWRISRQI
jgi:alpha-tubulin suppressor-like RCC1 family protein